MRRSSPIPFTPFILFALFAFLLSLATSPPLTHAAITFTGDVSPSDSTSWDSSTFGYVGYTSAGTATITSGTLSSSIGYIGHGNSASGVVTVDGDNSTWANNGYLYVGLNGMGALSIANGGSVSNTGSYIGHDTGSVGTVTVDGTGSKWTNNGSLRVGNYGTGMLSISNGGSVSSSGGNIANNIGATGVVTISGPGSTWTNTSNPILFGTEIVLCQRGRVGKIAGLARCDDSAHNETYGWHEAGRRP